MNNKLKKAMAIVSLVFMGLFVVSLVLCCIDIKLLNGQIGLVALFTGFVGISVYAVIRLSSRNAQPTEEGTEKDGADDDKSVENDTAANDTPADEENNVDTVETASAQASQDGSVSSDAEVNPTGENVRQQTNRMPKKSVGKTAAPPTKK